MRSLCAAVLVAALALLGCRPSEPLKVTTIQTGKSLNSDNSIATHAISFKPKDQMYVSVLTASRGSGKITVRWNYGGHVVHEVTKDVSYHDQAATDFRFQAADDFPVGEYIIEVLVDGKPLESRTVKVE